MRPGAALGHKRPMDAPPRTTHRAELGSRALFPDLAARSYLNHAAISPASLAVREQAKAVLDDYARGGLAGLEAWLPQKARLKETLAALLGGGVRGEDLGFVPNTTAGVVQVAFSLPWERGDRVVLFEGEFPANVTPWQQAAELFGLELVWVPLAPFYESVEAGLAATERALAGGARLVAVSAVEFQTGLRMPVEALGGLAHRHGAELFVDAIQGLGVVPLDVAEVDYVACGGHKWLMGLEGAGFLYVDPAAAARMVPRLAGWLGHEDALSFLFQGAGHLRYDRPLRHEASVVEQGAPNHVGLAALEASVDLIQQLGVEAIFAHVSAFHDRLEPQLVERGFTSKRAADPRARSGSLCVLPPEGVELGALKAALVEQGVDVTMPDGHLRFAPHWPNALEEVEWVVEAVDGAMGSGTR